MNEEISSYLHSKLDDDETILWWAKPKMSVFFKEEIQIIALLMLNIFIFISAFSLIAVRVYSTTPGDVYIGVILLSIPFIAILLQKILQWLYRKKHTYFILTNKRAIEIFKISFYQEYDWLEQDFEKIKSYQIRRRKNRGTLYLGRYRFRFSKPFDYYLKTIVKSKDYIPNLIYNSFNKLMNTIEYFCFFDLDDIDEPAMITKKFAINAVEYVE